MNRTTKKWLVLITGWAFLFWGVIGLFLPVLQGILFITIGLVVLSAEYTWAHHLLEKAKSRFPRLAHYVDHAKEFIETRLNHLRSHKGFSSNPIPDTEPFQPKEKTSEMP